MKAKCVKVFPVLTPFLLIGDIVEITPILYEKDTILCNAAYQRTKQGLELVNKEVIAKKGSVRDYELLNERTGKVLPDIYKLTGKPFPHFFEKVT